MLARLPLILTFILPLFGAAAPAWAQSDLCSTHLAAFTRDTMNEEFAAATGRCTDHWTGDLLQTGTQARVTAAVGLDLPDGFLDTVVAALIASDRASSLLGELSAGRGIEIVVAGPGARAPEREENEYAVAFSEGLICSVVVLNQSYASPEGIAEISAIIAHEFFHCIQAATVPTVYNGPDPEDGPGHDWLIEGSAEWYAHFVVPNRQHFFANRYEEAISNRPIHETSYGNWVFFAWLQSTFGPQRVLEYLRWMPADNANAETVLASMSDEHWSQFALSYALREVIGPDGRFIDPPTRAALGITNVPHDTDEATLTIPRVSAQMVRHRVSLGPGIWEISGPDGTIAHWLELDDTGEPVGSVEWLGDGPFETVVDCRQETAFLFTTFANTDEDYTLSVRYREETCAAECAVLPAASDQCLIGTWEVVNASDDFRNSPFVTMMQGMAMLGGGVIDTVNVHSETYVFEPNGDFRSNRPMTLAGSGVDGDPNLRVELDVRFNQDMGQWGAGGRRLTICTERNVWEATVTVNHPQEGVQTEDISTDQPVAGEEAGTVRYTCEGDRLTLRQGPFGLLGETKELRRVSGR